MNDDRLSRVLTSAAVLVVAAIAAVVSYIHIEHLAVVNGQTALAAMLLPLSIDGTVVASSMVMLRSARAGIRTPALARFGLGLAVAATLAANIGYGAAHGLAGELVSGWPAAAFIICAEMAIGMVRRISGQASGQVTGQSGGQAAGQEPATGAPTGPAIGAASDRPAARPRPAARRGRGRRSQADIEADALAVMAADPDISGAALGRAVGVSDRTGRRLREQLTAATGGHAGEEVAAAPGGAAA